MSVASDTSPTLGLRGHSVGRGPAAAVVIPTFSQNLENALQEVVPSTDPLDSPDFNPVDYINANFPDENSLSQGKLDAFARQLKRRIGTTTEGITKDIREFSTSKARTESAVVQAQHSMSELFSKIKAIKSKAEDSEIMVQEICRDIKSLDNGKRNLTASILALRNLHMLVSATEQLARMANDQQWRDAASLLCAIKDLLSLFSNHQDVPQIQALTAQVDSHKQRIKTQIFGDFQSLVPSSPLLDEARTQQRLHQACLVVDVLGVDVKEELLLWFTKTILQPYSSVFAAGQEGGSLDQTERRFAWLRRELKNYDQNYRQIFPELWLVQAVLSQALCSITAEHMSEMLKEGGHDINTLVRMLQRTLEFERELSMRFKPADLDAHLDSVQDDDDEHHRQGVAEAIRNKYSDKGKLSSKANNSFKFDFKGSISGQFAPYLSGFVDLERSNMQELVDRLQKEEKWTPDDDFEEKRLVGSDEFFLYIKKSIKRCTRLATNDTFLSVFKEYQRGLGLYTALLRSRLPVGEPQPLSASQILSLCLVANTAEYCNELTPALEELIRKTIDEGLKEQVSMSAAQEQFSVLLNQAVQAVASGVCAQMQRVLGGMAKLPWSAWEVVGDQSEYINELHAVLAELLPVVAKMLSPSYHTFFCTQLVSAFIPLYLEAIFKCKRIGQLGAQQMSLDAHALKSVLLSIPQITAPTEADDDVDDLAEAKPVQKKRPGAAARALTRYVNKEMGNVEALLKTLVSPAERLIDTFKALLPGGSSDDLVKVMNLRGLKKSEQQALVDAYNSQVGPSDKVTLVKSGPSLAKYFSLG